jgi:hypothetical protein
MKDSYELQNDIKEIIRDLNRDELSVLCKCASRLWAGRASYGQLCLRTDERDWGKEAQEEMIDAALYLAMRAV